MVTVNLTLIVELVLFLIFLWGANVLAFRPMLRTMDNRVAKVTEDRQVAQQGKLHADELETQYLRELLDTRRRLADDYRKAHRAGQDRHMLALAQRRREVEDDIARMRAELLAVVEQERKHYGQLVPEIVAAMDALSARGVRE